MIAGAPGAALAGLLAALALSGCASTTATGASPPVAAAATGALIPASLLAAMIAQGGVTLIDVRTPEEFTQGHIAGARNVPLDVFSADAVAADKPGKVVLYCRSGRRSQIAADRLVAGGGVPANQLDGGIMAWEAAGLPLAGAPAAPGGE